MPKNQKRTSSLENALALLSLFTMNEPELSVTSVSKKLFISKSTAHRLLSSLVQEGFVYKDARTRLYSLGASVLSLVNIVNSQIHISTEVIPLLNLLVEKTKESAHLSILDHQQTVYIQTIKGVYPCKDQINLGTQRPSYYTAAGQAIIAYHPELYDDLMIDLYTCTSNPVKLPSSFKQRMASIASKGYAISNGEWVKGVTELAVPVYKKHTDVIASISITANSDRITSPTIQKRYIRLLQHAAGELQKMIQLRRIEKDAKR
ncbi:transcriptional regulator [Virgibacillus pantothenticus]|uniref:IclR family transcriptional regulator n=1 Tax=Virgibacillus TaxID=84406 RepID=UPI00067E1792|nr:MULTISPECIES: IclR family transcriptional regulator [Virgibacillus]API93048.1 hypothetical protein BKP57_15275 [Virgibacillus sp. 6R]MBS7429271.1 IclR family transcriptional regulator [Virgibacillus sp. 19R1-5]MBU8567077.1 IclR family transcriptional regulator [Virgibacillus pantothenticus]MBU8600891.1 IclR family transcriptional regulator [Virgibacillus pantothenticus]MBU8635229.1 IclR family transcriptional regulator [Virgibacillus pantothenticus]